MTSLKRRCEIEQEPQTVCMKCRHVIVCMVFHDVGSYSCECGAPANVRPQKLVYDVVTGESRLAGDKHPYCHNVNDGNCTHFESLTRWQRFVRAMI